VPNPGLPPEEHARRIAVTQRHIAQGYGWQSRAARELTMDRSTLQSWCRKFGITGETPGDMVAEGFALKGYSEFTKTEHGTPIWLKTVKAERDYYAAVIEAINGRPARALDIPPPRLQAFDARDIVPWLNIGDAHIGMLAHEVEAAANFDLKIAKREILQAAFDLIDRAPDCETMVINDLGDGTHYENMKA